MWKKTRQTIRANPAMLLGFTIPIIIGLVLMVPIYKSIILAILGSSTSIKEIPGFPDIIHTIVIVAPILFVLLGVFVVPPLYRYVLEACTGTVAKGWVTRGIKKYWWKVIAETLFTYLILFAMSTILFLLFAIPTLGFATYAVAVFAWGVFCIISLTATIAEEKFLDSLPNMFFIGGRYYLRLLGTSLLILIPSFLISAWYLVYFHSVGLDATMAIPNIGMSPNLMVAVFIIVTVLLCIYYIFAQAFIYTYSMHHYIAESLKLKQLERMKADKEDDGDDI